MKKQQMGDFRYRPSLWMMALFQVIWGTLFLYGFFTGGILFIYVVLFVWTVLLLIVINGLNVVRNFLFRWNDNIVSPHFLVVYYSYIFSFIVVPVWGLFWYRQHEERCIHKKVVRAAYDELKKYENDWTYAGKGNVGLMLNLYESLIWILNRPKELFLFRYEQWLLETEAKTKKEEICTMDTTKKLLSLAHGIGIGAAIALMKDSITMRGGTIFFNDAVLLEELDDAFPLNVPEDVHSPQWPIEMLEYLYSLPE